MPARPLLPVVAITAVTFAVLTGCAPISLASGPSPTPSAPTEESPDAGNPFDIVDIPDDAVLVVLGTATAANGAVADFRLFVHAAVPFDSDSAADAVLATETWCSGEHDITTLAAEDYSFTTVDVSLTVRADSAAWPSDAPLLVLPLPGAYSTLAVAQPGGVLHQIEQPLVPEEGSYVPHCLQPVLLDGPGEGVIYLGLDGDKSGANGGDPFTAWTEHEYGLDSALPGSLAASAVTFSDCSALITPLGSELGAPTGSWFEDYTSTLCTVGGTAGP